MREIINEIVDDNIDTSKYTYVIKENTSKEQHNIITYGISIREKRSKLSKIVNVIVINDIKREMSTVIIQDGIKLAPTVLYNKTDYYENIKNDVKKYLTSIIIKAIKLLDTNITLKKKDTDRALRLNELIGSN